MKKKFLLGLVAILLPLASWAADDLTIEVSPANEKSSKIVYGGDNTPDSLKVTVKYEDKALEATQYVVFYTQTATGTNQVSVRDAGEYTAHAMITAFIDGLSIGQEVTTTFTVEKKQLEDFTLKEGEKEYGVPFDDLDLSVFVDDVKGLVEIENDEDAKAAEKANALKCLRLQRIDEEQGKEKAHNTYKVAVRPKQGDTGSNYYYDEGLDLKGIQMTIIPRKLIVSLAKENASRAYNAETTELKTLTPVLGTNKIVEGDNVTVEFTKAEGEKTKGTELKNVDKYTLTAELNGEDAGNYELTSDNSVSYEITRATLTITKAENKELRKIYDGKDIKDLTSYFTITTGTKETIKDLNLSMQKVDGANVGTYDVNPCVNGSALVVANYETPTKLPNYRVSYKRNENQYEITERPVNYYFAGKTEGYTGNAKESTTGLYEVAVVAGANEGFVEGHKFGVAPTAAFEENVTVKDAGNYTLVESTGKDVQKATVVVDGTDATDVTTNYSINYVANPTLAGNEATETEEAGEEESVNVNKYVISQANIKITVFEQELEFGKIKAGEPVSDEIQEKWLQARTGIDVTMPNSIVQPGRANDAATIRTMIAFTLSTDAATGQSGEYTDGIISQLKTLKSDEDWTDAQKAINKNYIIEWGKGKLTIKPVNENIEFSGWEDEKTEQTVAEQLEEYDGAMLQSVTIKELTNYVGYAAEDGYHFAEPTKEFEAKKWYTLVLPFDVEISELSKELGYAIVYVPNNEKTKMGANGWGEIYFTFTFDKIPANTMMLFRVDGSKDLSDGLTFTEKRIVNLTEEDKEGIEIGTNTGIKYVPVYAKKELESMDYTEWYLWTEEGSFNDVTSLIEYNYVEKVSVYPFNGYIKQPGYAAGARFFIEGTDGSTTEICTVTNKAVNGNSVEGWYTVGGLKLNAQPIQKGIYINNGKKVVIK